MNKDGVSSLPTVNHWRNLQIKSTKFYNLFDLKTFIIISDDDDFNDNGGSAVMIEEIPRVSLFHSSLYSTLTGSVHQLYTSISVNKVKFGKLDYLPRNSFHIFSILTNCGD